MSRYRTCCNELLTAAAAIREADRILITADAGLGVDSGLPDFRGQQGFWNTHPQYENAGLSFSDLTNPIWFFNNQQQRQRFYEWKSAMADKRIVTIELGAGTTIGGIRSRGNSMPGILIRINPSESEEPQGTLSIPMGVQGIDGIIQKQGA